MLKEGKDYTVTYDTDDFVNAGTITVTINADGVNYDGTVTLTYQITQRPITVTTGSASKVYDGTPLTAAGRVDNLVAGETVTVNTSSRIEVGTSDNLYTLTWDTADPANYVIVGETIGTLTITAVPVTPITPGDDDGDDGTTPTTDPGTGDDPAADDPTAGEAIAEAAVPLAAAAGGVAIADDATPMAAGDHRDCWVHWFMILGIVVTVAYTAGVVGRRSKFSGDLKNFEDKVLGNDQNNQ